jgi:hypothetical protein
MNHIKITNYQCEYCNYNPEKQQSLTRHMRHDHMVTNWRYYNPALPKPNHISAACIGYNHKRCKGKNFYRGKRCECYCHYCHQS